MTEPSGATSLLARLAALAALAGYLAAAIVLPLALVANVAALIGGCALGVVAFVAAWSALVRRGLARVLAVLAMVAAGGGAAWLVGSAHHPLYLVALAVLLVAATVLARLAVGAGTPGPADDPSVRPARPGRHPVLFINPKSGDGKAEAHDLEAEATKRGIQAVTFGGGDDLVELVREAIEGGADVMGVAGGDGSQALAARVAIEHDVPFVVVPAGTRNHFALDLGIDRDDVVGALDAYSRGMEHRVDVAWMNDCLFVNNACLGIYAEVVQSPEYRDAKLRTVLTMLPDLLGPDADPCELDFDPPPAPDDAGASEETGAPEEPGADLLLVSNNVYDLEGLGASGSRARLDQGVLGIVAVHVASAAEAARLAGLQVTGAPDRHPGWHAWTATEFEVRSPGPVEVGVDGEAMEAEAPVRFRIDPGALRVRVASHHPGRSPAFLKPRWDRQTLVRLATIAWRGVDPKVSHAPAPPP